MNAQEARLTAHASNADHGRKLIEVSAMIEAAAKRGEYRLEIYGSMNENKCYESIIPKFVVESLRDQGFKVLDDSAVLQIILW